MSTRSLANILEQELDRLAPRYASLCTQHPPLSAYPTLPALVSRFTDPKKNQSAMAQCERSELIAAVIGAFQPTRDRLWAAILVAAFRPMLAKKYFYGAEPDEREAIFFAALVEVVDKLDVREKPEEMHAIVWRAAKRVLVRKLRRQVAWSEVGFGEEADETPDSTSFLPEPLLALWLIGRGREDWPDVDLLIRAQQWGSLRAYVEAEYAALPPKERSRVYGQLYRRQRCDIAELRERLGGALAQSQPRGPVPSPENRTRIRIDAAPANVGNNEAGCEALRVRAQRRRRRKVKIMASALQNNRGVDGH